MVFNWEEFTARIAVLLYLLNILAPSRRIPARAGAIRACSGKLWADPGRIPARTAAIRACSGMFWAHSWRTPGALWFTQARSGHVSAESKHALGSLWWDSGLRRRSPGTVPQSLGTLWAHLCKSNAQLFGIRNPLNLPHQHHSHYTCRPHLEPGGQCPNNVSSLL